MCMTSCAMANDPPDYTVERVRTTPAGNLVYELVLADLTRRHVVIPRRRATDGPREATIAHALANVYRPTKPL